MSNLLAGLQYVLAFLVAIGVLVTVHEWGHYRVAKWCGVRVLRFSIGFGKPLFKWHLRGNSTEFVLSSIPLGGYVRMLDAREGPVGQADGPEEFTGKPIWQRVAIVLAGPVANLVLATLLYAAVAWIGQAQPVAVLSQPSVGTAAYEAGLRSGDRVVEVQLAGAVRSISTFEQLTWQLGQAVAGGTDLVMRVERSGAVQELRLAIGGMSKEGVDDAAMARIGLPPPKSEPVIGEVEPAGAAQAAGLKPGDRVLSIDGQAPPDAWAVRQLIRNRYSNEKAGANGQMLWRVDRGGSVLELTVEPRKVASSGSGVVGRVGAVVGAPVETVQVQHGVLGGLAAGAQKTWEVSALSLGLLGKMLVGQASIKNLSGPFSIAEYAGKSAALGLVAFLAFLAMLSVSLGVMNLLPIPALDGGHLMYYLWEGLSGRPVSPQVAEKLQRVGVFLLVLLMSVAIANDGLRLSR